MAILDDLLCPKGTEYAAARTDLKQGLGKPLFMNACTLLLCTEGRSVVTINFKKQILKKGDIALMFSDIFFVPVQTSSTFSLIYVSLPEEAVQEAFYKITSISFWEFIYDNPILSLNDKQYELLFHWFGQIKWVVGECTPEYRLNILSSSLYNLFMAVDSELRRSDPSSIKRTRKNRAWTLLGKFYSLLSKHCHQNREVKFYAEKMCITTDYLYKITDKTMQQTPKEIITEQVINEIKTYLTHTDMTIKDIAHEMNFDDPPYMCRFFRKMTGYAPGEYRQLYV